MIDEHKEALIATLNAIPSHYDGWTTIAYDAIKDTLEFDGHGCGAFIGKASRPETGFRIDCDDVADLMWVHVSNDHLLHFDLGDGVLVIVDREAQRS